MTFSTGAARRPSFRLTLLACASAFAVSAVAAEVPADPARSETVDGATAVEGGSFSHTGGQNYLGDGDTRSATLNWGRPIGMGQFGYFSPFGITGVYDYARLTQPF